MEDKRVVWVLWFRNECGEVVTARVHRDHQRGLEDLDLVEGASNLEWHLDESYLYG